MPGYRIERVGADRLAEYKRVPISFSAGSILEVTRPGDGLGGIVFEEREVTPFIKDYDATESPLSWPRTFDTSEWRFFLALAGGEPVGGAAVAMRTDGVRMLEGRDDLACLWDIRVHPSWRQRGLGTALFSAAAGCARESGCTLMKVETQNINVAANRFYRARGCYLGQVHLHAYDGRPGCEGEIMLIWYLDLANDPSA